MHPNIKKEDRECTKVVCTTEFVCTVCGHRSENPLNVEGHYAKDHCVVASVKCYDRILYKFSSEEDARLFLKYNCNHNQHQLWAKICPGYWYYIALSQESGRNDIYYIRDINTYLSEQKNQIANMQSEVDDIEACIENAKSEDSIA